MADSFNGFSNMLPMFKESYADSGEAQAMKTHQRPGKEISYSDKLQKIVSKPNNSKQYFRYLKKKIKEASKGYK